jgi:arylsulfatase
MKFKYDGDGVGKGGMASIFVDGEKVAEGRVEKTQPVLFSADDTADVGQDDATQVVPIFKDVHDSKFTGYVRSVEVSIGE